MHLSTFPFFPTVVQLWKFYGIPVHRATAGQFPAHTVLRNGIPAKCPFNKNPPASFWVYQFPGFSSLHTLTSEHQWPTMDWFKGSCQSSYSTLGHTPHSTHRKQDLCSVWSGQADQPGRPWLSWMICNCHRRTTPYWRNKSGPAHRAQWLVCWGRTCRQDVCRADLWWRGDENNTHTELWHLRQNGAVVAGLFHTRPPYLKRWKLKLTIFIEFYLIIYRLLKHLKGCFTTARPVSIDQRTKKIR